MAKKQGKGNAGNNNRNNNNNNNNNTHSQNGVQKRGKNGQNNGHGHSNSNNAKKVCTVCKKSGHTEENCHFNKNKANNGNSNNNSNNRDITCNNCGKKGHKAADCRQKSGQGKGNSNPQGKGVTRPCSICKGRHLDKDCNAKSKTGKDGKPITCKHCGGPHYNNQCFQKEDPDFPNNTGKRNGQGDYNPNIRQPLTMSGLVLRPCRYCGGEHLGDHCPHKDVLDAQREFQEPNQAAYSYPSSNLFVDHLEPKQDWYAAASTNIHPVWGFIKNSSRKWQDDDNSRYTGHPDDRVPAHPYISNSFLAYSDNSGHPAFRERYPTKERYDDENDVIMEDVDNEPNFGFTNQQNLDNFQQGIRDATLEAVHIRRRLSEMRRAGIVDGEYKPMFGY